MFFNFLLILLLTQLGSSLGSDTEIQRYKDKKIQKKFWTFPESGKYNIFFIFKAFDIKMNIFGNLFSYLGNFFEK